MDILASNGPLGTKVAQNTVLLSADISDTDNQMNVDDPSIIQANDYLVIESEVVKATSGGSNPISITRAQDNGEGQQTTADSHTAGCFVRKRGGTEILQHTFNGSEWLSQVRVSGERQFWVGIEIDGDIEYFEAVANEELAAVFPFPRYQPANNMVIKVLIWTTETRQFTAMFLS